MRAIDLAGLTLLHDIPASELEPLANRLTRREYAPGDVIFGQGDAGASFLLILDGSAHVTRSGRSAVHDLGISGTGSILGELSAVTGDPRRATVTAESTVVAAVGELDAFDLLLSLPGVTAELVDLAAQRLAEIARPLSIRLDDGTALGIRPLLPRDRDEFAAILRGQPREWIHSRFFSGGTPTPAVVDYLSHLDYVGHFAWLVGTSDPLQGLAVGRYIRSADDPTLAELAFEVTDEWRGRGLGSLLLGALGVAAGPAGIERFHAETLAENRSMQQVLKKAGAKFVRGEAGVKETTIIVQDARALFPAELRDRLCEVAEEIVTGAGLALHSQTPRRGSDRTPAKP